MTGLNALHSFQRPVVILPIYTYAAFHFVNLYSGRIILI
jgi:hypothetical protein